MQTDISRLIGHSTFDNNIFEFNSNQWSIVLKVDYGLIVLYLIELFEVLFDL